MTELSPVATQGSTTKRGDYPGTCGVLVPNTEAKFIAVEDGRELEQGQTGELCIRGPQVMQTSGPRPGPGTGSARVFAELGCKKIEFKK